MRHQRVYICHQTFPFLLQHQQKKVSEENSVFFDILQKALPCPSAEEREDHLAREGALGDIGGAGGLVGNGVDNTSGKK